MPKIGYKHTEEARIKISNALKGKVTWMKGKKHTKEARLKNRLAHIGKSLGMKGKKHTEEAKMKMRDALKGRIVWNKGILLSEEHRKKLSIGHKGQLAWNKGKTDIYSEETKRRISNAIKGKNNPNWLGGKSFEPYDQSFDNLFKRRIRKRDNQICMLCGIHKEKLNKALSVHHINYDKKLSIPQNCISLCISCHLKTNHNREHWIKFFQSLLSERYNYQYSNDKEIILDLTKFQKEVIK